MGAKYNSITNEAIIKLSVSNSTRLKKNDIVSKNFVEGSGDNQILGQLICKSNKVNGIRNIIDQNELAVCDPSKFLKIEKVHEINLDDLLEHKDYIQDIR